MFRLVRIDDRPGSAADTTPRSADPTVGSAETVRSDRGVSDSKSRGRWRITAAVWIWGAILGLVAMTAGGIAWGQDPEAPTTGPATPRATTPNVLDGPGGLESPLETTYVPDRNGKLVPVMSSFRWEELEAFFQRERAGDGGLPSVRLTVRSVSVRGDCDYHRATLTVRLSVLLLADGWSAIPWDLRGMLLTEPPRWTAKGTVVVADGEGGGRRVWISGERGSEGELTVRLIRPVAWASDRYELTMGLPSSTQNDWEVTLPAGASVLTSETEAMLPPRIDRQLDGRLNVKVWPQTETVRLVWSRTDGLGTGGQVPLTVEETSNVTFDGQAKVLYDSHFLVQAEQTLFDEVWLRLPAAGTVIDLLPEPGVTREIVRERPLPTENGVERGRFLRITTDRPRDRLEFSVQMEVRKTGDAARTGDDGLPFEVVDAIRQTGTVNLLLDSSWNLTWTAGPNVTRLEPSGRVRPAARFRYDGRPASLTVQVRRRIDRVRCDPVWTLTVDERQVRLIGQLSVLTTGGEALVVEMPGWNVASVEPAAAIEPSLFDPFASPLRIPLVRSQNAEPMPRTVTIRADRSLEPGQTELSIPLPVVTSAEGGPPLVRVRAAESIRLIERLDRMPGVTPVVGEPAWPESEVPNGVAVPLTSPTVRGGGTTTPETPNEQVAGAASSQAAARRSSDPNQASRSMPENPRNGSDSSGSAGLSGSGPTGSSTPGGRTLNDEVARPRSTGPFGSGETIRGDRTDGTDSDGASRLVMQFRDFREGVERPFLATIERLPGQITVSGDQKLTIELGRLQLNQSLSIVIDREPRRFLDLAVPSWWTAPSDVGGSSTLPSITIDGVALDSSQLVWKRLDDEARTLPSDDRPGETLRSDSAQNDLPLDVASSKNPSSNPSASSVAASRVQASDAVASSRPAPPGTASPVSSPGTLDRLVADEDDDSAERRRHLQIDLGRYRRGTVALSMTWSRSIPPLLPGQTRSATIPVPRLEGVTGAAVGSTTVTWASPLLGRWEPTATIDMARRDGPSPSSGSSEWTERVVSDRPLDAALPLRWDHRIATPAGGWAVERAWIWTHLASDVRLDRLVMSVRGTPESLKLDVPMDVHVRPLRAVWGGRAARVDTSEFPTLRIERPLPESGAATTGLEPRRGVGSDRDGNSVSRAGSEPRQTIELIFSRPRVSIFWTRVLLAAPRIEGADLPIPFAWLIETGSDTLAIDTVGGTPGPERWGRRGLLWQPEPTLQAGDLERVFGAMPTVGELPSGPRTVLTGVIGPDVAVTLVDRGWLLAGLLVTALLVAGAVVTVPWLRSLPAIVLSLTALAGLLAIAPTVGVWFLEAATAAAVLGGVAVLLQRAFGRRSKRHVMQVPTTLGDGSRPRQNATGSSFARTDEHLAAEVAP